MKPVPPTLYPCLTLFSILTNKKQNFKDLIIKLDNRI